MLGMSGISNLHHKLVLTDLINRSCIHYATSRRRSASILNPLDISLAILSRPHGVVPSMA